MPFRMQMSFHFVDQKGHVSSPVAAAQLADRQQTSWGTVVAARVEPMRRALQSGGIVRNRIGHVDNGIAIELEGILHHPVIVADFDPFAVEEIIAVYRPIATA